MAILIVGGAGYLGSHAVRALMESGRQVVVFDSHEAGSREATADAAFIKGDLRTKADVQKVFKKHKIEAVMHCAARSSVGASMEKPERYYENNVAGTLNLVTAMKDAGVMHLVFSSTCAIYGESERIPIDEEHPQNPVSAYGHTALCAEGLLGWFDRIYGIKSVVLRCFNAAGADPSGQPGEWHDSEMYLVPLAIQAALGGRDHVSVFGTDYPTRDGTCVRDYVHVCDLADAHSLALDWLASGKPSAVFNLGSGTGSSVREIIEAVEKVTGKKIEQQAVPRRPGDPAIVVAGARKARLELGWQPRFKDIRAIIETAVRWHTGTAKNRV